jgi:hypothetical protein
MMVGGTVRDVCAGHHRVLHTQHYECVSFNALTSTIAHSARERAGVGALRFSNMQMTSLSEYLHTMLRVVNCLTMTHPGEFHTNRIIHGTVECDRCANDHFDSSVVL